MVFLAQDLPIVKKLGGRTGNLYYRSDSFVLDSKR